MAEQLKTLIFPFINLVIFAGLLVFLLRKPISNFLKARRNAVIGNIEESKKIFEEAHSRVSVVRQKMANIDKEGEAFISSMQADAKYLTKRLIEEARQKAQMTEKEVNLIIEAEEAQKWQLFRTNFVSMVIGSARKDMEINLKDGDSDRFLKDIRS
jgi:F0F1-type ATP synthase membrane subunit b/b'